MSDTGRPNDPEQVRALAAIQCTDEEIGARIGLDAGQVRARFGPAIDEARSQGIAAVKKAYFEAALAGDVKAQARLIDRSIHAKRTEGEQGLWSKLSRSDMKMLRGAVEGRERWAVPEELRNDLMLTLARMLVDPKVRDRDRLAAAKTLAALDRGDQYDDLLDVRRGMPPGGEEDGRIDPAIAAAALREARRMGSNGDGEPHD